MQLNAARLCLDCQEVHEQDHCPSCGSESFAFLTRWVRLEAVTAPRRPPPPPAEPTERLEAYRQLLNTEEDSKKPAAGKVLARGALGLAVLGAARLLWRARATKADQPAADQGAPDEKSDAGSAS